MNQRARSLSARVEKLERVARPEGDRFWMIWGKTETDLADTLSRAKISGVLPTGSKFDARLWTSATEPPPARWTTLAEMDRDELTIIAGCEDGKIKAVNSELVCLSDAELSTWYANNLPSLT